MPPTDPAPDLLSPPDDPPPDLFPDNGVDLRDSTDPRRLIPGDPDGLRAAARRLVDNAGVHQAIAARHRNLHDGGWTGEAADAFHIAT